MVRFARPPEAPLVRFARPPEAPLVRFARILSLNVYAVLVAMDEEIFERRVQLRGGSFVLTIPRAVAIETGMCKGQGARFQVQDGRIVIRLTGVAGDGGPGYAGPDEFVRAVDEMTARDRSEKPKGAASRQSKLERLRLK